MGFEIDHCFETIYLGNMPTDFNAQDKYILKMLLAKRKKTTTRKQMNENRPTKEEWIMIVKDILYGENELFSDKLWLNYMRNGRNGHCLQEMDSA